MSVEDIAEQRLRMELMTMQIDKTRFDIEAERRRSRRETWSIFLSVFALAVAAFAAGHFIR